MDSEVRKDFLETLPEIQRNAASDILDKVTIQEKNSRRNIEEFNKSDFVKLLERCVHHARNTFSSRKKFLYKYMEWLEEKNCTTIQSLAVLREVTYEDLRLDKTIEREFFRDSKSFYYTMEWAKEIVTSNSSSAEEAYDLPIVSLFLAYEGATLDEVIEIKKTDIDLDTRIWLPISKRHIHPEPEVLQQIIFFKDATSYAVNPKATKTYCESEYLLRTYLNSKLTKQQVQAVVSKYNLKTRGKMPKVLTYGRVWLSGVFFRAHSKETEEQNVSKMILSPLDVRIPQLASFFGVDFKPGREATDMARSYLMWRKFYYGN